MEAFLRFSLQFSLNDDYIFSIYDSPKYDEIWSIVVFFGSFFNGVVDSFTSFPGGNQVDGLPLAFSFAYFVEWQFLFLL